jgi:D-3-phosphoglycerate dehydrogenase
LKQNNYEVIPNPYGRKLTEEEVMELSKDCVGIVAGVEPITHYAAKKGIIIKNTPGGPSQAVTELTVALVFNLLRKISKTDANIRKGAWKKEIGNSTDALKIMKIIDKVYQKG